MEDSMNRSHIAIALVTIGFGCASAAASTAQPSGRGRAAPDASAARLVVMPARIVDDKGFAGGCWVHFYDGIDFRGRQLTLVGPLDLANMKETGEPWRDWDSVVVGPKARVTTYDAENFQGPAAKLEPRQRIKDLTRETGRFDDIESVQLSCASD
jgi:hypothetical protein